MYINFKSEYNFLQSAVTIEKIIEYAKEKNLTHVGICDQATTFANFKFYKACIKANIKPIIGTEFTINGQTYLLYARNYEGIKRLNFLTSSFIRNGYIKFNDSEENLIIVIERGTVAKAILENKKSKELERLKSVFQHIFFGILSNLNDPINYERFIHIKDIGLKPLLVDPIKYISNDDYDVFVTLNAIHENKKFTELNKNKQYYKQFQVKEYNDLNFDEFRYNSEFFDLIDIIYPDKVTTPPRYPFLKEGVSSSVYLTELCKRGVNKRLNNDVPKLYKDRLMYELDVIIQMGYADYFLIVWDIVLFAKNKDIYIGPGRGSAAGSLVSYALGITEIDPVQNDLIFERFLNPERISMPDIDMDFEDIRRNEIVEYIIQRFGDEHVCKIATITKFLAKSAFRDVAKVWDIEPNKIEYIAKELNFFKTFKENVMGNKKIQSELITNHKLKIVFEIITAIEGMPRQTSIHAAGVVITDQHINNYTAIDFDHVTLAEASELEEMGLLKFDILALSNLTFIHRIVNKINEMHHPFSLKDIPSEDKKALQILKEGRTIGIFQMESAGMRSTVMQVAPSSFRDIANVLSLYRPGPKEFIGDYVKNKETFKVKTEIDEIIKDSNGIIIYQEQIILIAQKMAGYTLGQADVLRRAISKKDFDTLNNLGDDFIERGVDLGYDKDYVTRTFELISRFANYGFNKAHAYSYATIVYQMSYLKAHYPDLFYAELFYYNFKSSKRDDFLLELKKQKIKLLAPSVLYSDLEVSVEPNAIRMGLLTIDGIGVEIANKIVANRQYINLEEKFEQIMLKLFEDIKISQAQIERLIDAGCFDDFNYTHNTLKHNLHKILAKDALEVLSIMNANLEFDEYEEINFDELSRLEKKALGININYLYFETIKKELEKKINQKLFTLDQMLTEGMGLKIDITRLCIFKIISIKEITTKKGQKMAFLTVQSEQIYEVTIFPRVYGEKKEIIQQNVGNNVVALVKCENESFYLQKI